MYHSFRLTLVGKSDNAVGKVHFKTLSSLRRVFYDFTKNWSPSKPEVNLISHHCCVIICLCPETQPPQGSFQVSHCPVWHDAVFRMHVCTVNERFWKSKRTHLRKQWTDSFEKGERFGFVMESWSHIWTTDKNYYQKDHTKYCLVIFRDWYYITLQYKVHKPTPPPLSFPSTDL